MRVGAWRCCYLAVAVFHSEGGREETDPVDVAREIGAFAAVMALWGHYGVAIMCLSVEWFIGRGNNPGRPVL